MAGNTFEKEKLGIKVFEKIDHPKHIVELLKDKDMKKKIVLFLKNQRAKMVWILFLAKKTDLILKKRI